MKVTNPFLVELKISLKILIMTLFLVQLSIKLKKKILGDVLKSCED